MQTSTEIEFLRRAREIEQDPARPSDAIFRRFAEPTLAWLALAPSWPYEIALRGFPLNKKEIGTGDAVRQLLEEVAEHHLGEVNPRGVLWEGPTLWLTEGNREAVLKSLMRDKRFGIDYLSRELRNAALQMEQSADGLLSTDPMLNCWVTLAKLREPDAIARELNANVDRSISAAEEHAHPQAPEAETWIKSASFLAKVFGQQVEASQQRCQHKLDLYYREATDRALLKKNYFDRPTLDEALLDLLGNSQQWALHFIGVGGTGKTMLMRHLGIHLADEQNLAVARIDFDYLNPDFPARNPSLMLTALADELRLRAPSAQSRFMRFDADARALEDLIRGAYHEGSPPAPAVVQERLDRIINSFAQCLAALEGKRPVLILDTCEELSRIRPNGSIPPTVARTFDILEKVHEQFADVRVVFSGRRSLPQTGYLRVHRVTGFDPDEALRFLEQYEGGGVKASLFKPILALSVSVEQNEEGEDEPAWTRYNPYDLDLYASWAAADPTLDELRLQRAGRHYYVKERIVARLTPDMRRLMRRLVVLERFDRDMLRKLIPESENRDNVVSDVLALEIVHSDRGGARDVWILDRVIRDRLMTYYQHERMAELAAARHDVANLLVVETIERRFSDLTVHAFAAAVEALAETPGRGAEWWGQVEQKIAHHREWEWGLEMISLVLEQDALDPDRSESLRAAVMATQAACLRHVYGTEQTELWRTVLDLADLPLHNNAILVLRARFALGDLHAALPEPLWSNRELVAANLAMLEDSVEQVELQDWTLQRDINVLLQPARRITAEAPDHQLRTFARCLEARILAGQGDEAGAGAAFESAWHEAKSSAPMNAFVDWCTPEDLATRMLLEWARWLRRSSGDLSPIHGAMQEAPRVMSIDTDRLNSLLHTDRAQQPSTADVPYWANDPHYRASVAHEGAAPRCNAHRQVPPYFIVALHFADLDADASDYSTLDELSARQHAAETGGRPELAIAAAREITWIVMKMRLLSEGREVPDAMMTSGHESDRVLANATEALHGVPRAMAPTDAQWKIIESSALILSDRDEVDLKLARLGLAAPASDALEYVGQVAQMYGLSEEVVRDALLNSSLTPFLDPRGMLRARIADTLLAARNQPTVDLKVSLSRLRSKYEAVASELPLPAWQSLQEAANGGDALRDCLQEVHRSAPLWRPWIVRILACLVAELPEKRANKVAAELLEWLHRHYAITTGKMRALPPELAFVEHLATTMTLEHTLASVYVGGKSHTLSRANDTILPDDESDESAEVFGDGGASGPGIEEAPSRTSSATRQVLIIVGGFAVVACTLVGGYWLWSRGASFLGFESYHLATYIAFWALLASAQTIMRAYMVFYARILGYRVRIEPMPIDDASRPLANAGSMQQDLYLKFLSAFPFSRHSTEHAAVPVEEQLAYRDLNKAIHPTATPARGPSRAVFRIVARWARIDTELEVPTESAATCWEAALVEFSESDPFSDWPWVFRRVSSQRSRPLPPTGSSISVTMLTLDPSRRELEYARTGSSDAAGSVHINFAAWDYSAKLPVDSTVLMIRGTAMETSSGLRMRLEQDSREYDSVADPRSLVDPRELISRMPALRLCVLISSQPLALSRGPGERREAALTRRIAAEIFEAGLPAVLVVPALPEPISREPVVRLAKLLRKHPHNATRRLLDMVRDLQLRVISEENIDQLVRTETALDFCLYARRRVDFRGESR